MVFLARQANCLTWNFVDGSFPFIPSLHTVTRGAVVFFYPGKNILRDPTLSVPPKPFDSVVAVSTRNQTAVGRSPFYPFYNGIRPPSFPRANDSSRRYGGKGTTLTPFYHINVLHLLFSFTLLVSLSLAFFQTRTVFLIDSSCWMMSKSSKPHTPVHILATFCSQAPVKAVILNPRMHDLVFDL